MVYVINIKGNALMPCSNAIARLLLKSNKAKCIRQTPFTIKLKIQTKEYKQDLTLGVDTGSSKIGTAVTDDTNNVVYMSEVEVRNDISKKMDRRLSYRRNRRNRKTRYREPRFLNRGNSTKVDRFSPTMKSKIDSHMKEIDFIKSILPIKNIIIETASFDAHALKNPDVLKDKNLYQKGANYGFANTKAFVLVRDNHTCQSCKGKTKSRRLEVHHIVYRRDGGSDEESNLITLCDICHKKVHLNIITIKGGKDKGNLRFATQMNSIRIQLLRKIPEAIETFGFITKENRQLIGLSKEHYFDAVIIASQGEDVKFKISKVYIKKEISIGDYQQSKGIRSQQKIPTGKIEGFRKFDKVKYLGKEYFIKGRMSSGYAILMDISGEKIDFNNAPKGMKTAKLKNLIRVSGRTSQMVDARRVLIKIGSLLDLLQ